MDNLKAESSAGSNGVEKARGCNCSPRQASTRPQFPRQIIVGFIVRVGLFDIKLFAVIVILNNYGRCHRRRRSLPL
jgi:hypothetical protein